MHMMLSQCLSVFDFWVEKLGEYTVMHISFAALRRREKNLVLLSSIHPQLNSFSFSALCATRFVFSAWLCCILLLRERIFGECDTLAGSSLSINNDYMMAK